MLNKKISSQLALAVLSLAFLFSVNASAQKGKDKKINVSFENELVEGAADNPSVETIFSKSRMDFKKMIKLRENFIPEADRGKGEFSGNR